MNNFPQIRIIFQTNSWLDHLPTCFELLINVHCDGILRQIMLVVFPSRLKLCVMRKYLKSKQPYVGCLLFKGGMVKAQASKVIR